MIIKFSQIMPVGIALALLAQPSEAQSVDRFSVQGTFLGMKIFNYADSVGLEKGGEVQLRYNSGALSIGVGVMFSPLSAVAGGTVTWDTPRPCSEGDHFCQEQDPTQNGR